MNNEEFKKKLQEVMSYMEDILVKKNASYGSASFQGEGIMPLLGNMFRLRDKMNRYENLMTKCVNTKVDFSSSEQNPFGESVWDTVCDMWGYASIGLIILDSLGMGKLPKESEDLVTDFFYDQYKKSLEKTKEEKK